MYFRLSAPIALAFLAACATPQEACISQAQSEVRSIRNQISTAEGNISRGYAIHRQTVPYTYVSVCYTEAGESYQCEETGTRVEETPVAIDIAQERIKLAELRARLPAAQRRADAQVEQCRLTYPE